MQLDLNKKPHGCTKDEWRLFIKHADLCSRYQRRMLDRLERARPDMAPLKLFDKVSSNLKRECFTLMRPGGCYRVTWTWVRSEYKRIEAERERERQQEIEAAIGVGI
jgi:hypothetical protein